VQVNDEEEYDQLALQDLERGETDRLVSSR
jgi:hypothetical protein